ncbi:Hypp3264 [Branchiostoma lanceolatum]|uniref:Hypp3264 protein n=1 Tax=Branchiostoma lanceolatum TaxID=7740 RepID=A0A8K0A104_BRALA|nr:Hypp3264 [Branchiostoma lanceolatum]
MASDIPPQVLQDDIETMQTFWAERKQRTSRLYQTAKLAGFLFSIVFLTLIQFLYFGVILKIWGPEKTAVDRDSCTCTCWDTVFKGTYEMGVGRYKHVYFNVTAQTFKMCGLTVVAIIMTYECTSYVVRIALCGRIRYSMLALLVAVIHPHYYSWWMFFGYYNDDFYVQWYHQLLFTLTELFSTALVLSMLDRGVKPTPRKLFTVASISLLHILAGGMDQFVSNVVLGRGMFHQVSRDIAFFSSDFFYLIVAWAELAMLCARENIPASLLLMSLKRDIITSAVIISGVLLILSYI